MSEMQHKSQSTHLDTSRVVLPSEPAGETSYVFLSLGTTGIPCLVASYYSFDVSSIFTALTVTDPLIHKVSCGLNRSRIIAPSRPFIQPHLQNPFCYTEALSKMPFIAQDNIIAFIGSK